MTKPPISGVAPVIGSAKLRRWSPRRDVAWALALKAALLLMLYVVCVAPQHRDPVTPAQIAAALTLAAPRR
jgi:hypothetical protein